MELSTSHPEWKVDPGISEAALDEQHKKLFDMADEIQDAMRHGTGEAILHEHLNDMIDFTQTHFVAEEQSMRVHDYPALNLHKGEHDRLLRQIEDLQRKMQEGKQIFSMDVIYFLRHWIMDHVTNMDGAYDAYLKRMKV